MLFTLSSEHHDFFSKHQYIEFEDLLSLEEASELKNSLDQALAKRLKIPAEKLESKKTLDLYMNARSLSKDDPAIKKMVLRSKISDIAGALYKKPPLRLAYDQYLRTGNYPDSLFEENFSLQDISCFQPITGGLILRLSEETAEPSAMNYTPMPKKIGSGIFLGPKLRLSLTTLFQIPRLKLLLLVFCGDRTLYAFEKNDPLTHALKKEGYAFGDSIKNDAHPIIFR